MTTWTFLDSSFDGGFHPRLRNYSSHDGHFVRPSRWDAFFLPTVPGRCFRWGMENTSANLHSKFARCTVTFRGLRPRRKRGRTAGWTVVCEPVYFLDPPPPSSPHDVAYCSESILRKKISIHELAERERKFILRAHGQFLKFFFYIRLINEEIFREISRLFSVPENNVIQFNIFKIIYSIFGPTSCILSA